MQIRKTRSNRWKEIVEISSAAAVVNWRAKNKRGKLIPAFATGVIMNCVHHAA